MTPDELKTALAEWTWQPPNTAMHEINAALDETWGRSGFCSPLSDAAIPELMARLRAKWGRYWFMVDGDRCVVLLPSGHRFEARTEVGALWLAVLAGGE